MEKLMVNILNDQEIKKIEADYLNKINIIYILKRMKKIIQKIVNIYILIKTKK